MELPPNLKLEDLEANNPLAWVYLNKFVTENQKPIEYKNHRFLIDPMNDMHPDQVVRKSAQVGWSVLEILRSFWLAKYKGLNTGYVLPSQSIVKDFVMPKVDPIITSNPKIEGMVSKDSVALKQVGDRFVYFRGAFSEREAIAISLDVLALDELDRMTDATIVNMYDSRLQASEYGWRRRFSNPSGVGYGVDALYQDSDQMHWFIRHKCGHRMFIDFEYDKHYKNHYLNQEAIEFVCGKCEKPITDAERRNGEWVAKYPKRNRRGYWVSQLMAPWVSAKRIMEQKEDYASDDLFYNFVLGKAYTPSDLIVDRATILRATSPSRISYQDMALGVDNGITKTWVLGTPDGIVDHGETESWEDIERLIDMYKPYVVIDPLPYPTDPKRLVDKYHRKVFICYFKSSTTGLKIVEWGKGDKMGVVYADRTKILDLVANEIVEGTMIFRESPHNLEDYISHWSHMYRATEEDEKGKVKTNWITQEGKPDHFALATVYYRIALSKAMRTGETTFVEPRTQSKQHDYVDKHGKLQSEFHKDVKRAVEQQEDTDWRHT